MQHVLHKPHAFTAQVSAVECYLPIEAMDMGYLIHRPSLSATQHFLHYAQKNTLQPFLHYAYR
jgi:hypothetical protein